MRVGSKNGSNTRGSPACHAVLETRVTRGAQRVTRSSRAAGGLNRLRSWWNSVRQSWMSVTRLQVRVERTIKLKLRLKNLKNPRVDPFKKLKSLDWFYERSYDGLIKWNFPYKYKGMEQRKFAWKWAHPNSE